MTPKWENLVEFGEISKSSGISHKMAQITNIQTLSFLYSLRLAGEYVLIGGRGHVYEC